LLFTISAFKPKQGEWMEALHGKKPRWLEKSLKTLFLRRGRWDNKVDGPRGMHFTLGESWGSDFKI